MKLDIYLHQDYKAYLSAVIENAEPKHGFISRLAKAAGCQRSYLSQVMNTHVQLTPDHGLAIAQFLKLDEKETDFFLMLLDLARAGTPLLRRRLLTKVEKTIKDRKNLAKRVEAKTIEASAAESRYYSSWHWMAIHLALAIPQYQTVQALAARLSLSEATIESALGELLKMGYVENQSELWHYRGSNLHLSRESPSVTIHHNNWRQRAVMDSAISTDDSVHYTSVLAMSVRDIERLKERALAFIDESRALAGPSESEELVSFCLDLFKV